MNNQVRRSISLPDDPAAAASELNNLLHIIAGTADLLGNVWQDTPMADKYVSMLRTSIDRAVSVTSELIGAATSNDDKIVLHPAVLQQAGQCLRESLPRNVSPERPRLLVVDDEPMALELAKHLLTRKGYEVTTASNGCECLSHFSLKPDSFALVILDLAMPLMDGEETFDRLRAIKPGLPVLLHTGFIDSARGEAMLARGLLAILPKPLRADDYLAKIRSALNVIDAPKPEVAIIA